MQRGRGGENVTDITVAVGGLHRDGEVGVVHGGKRFGGTGRGGAHGSIGGKDGGPGVAGRAQQTVLDDRLDPIGVAGARRDAGAEVDDLLVKKEPRFFCPKVRLSGFVVHPGGTKFTEDGRTADPRFGRAGIDCVGRVRARIGAEAGVHRDASEPVGIGGGPVLVGVLAEITRVKIGGAVAEVPAAEILGVDAFVFGNPF